MTTRRTTVRVITEALGETAPKPCGQIERIVRFCGADQALAWLAAAQAIEGTGGVLTCDGVRRRTPGGVFFYLVRQDLLAANRHDDLRAIFGRSLIQRPPDERISAPPGSDAPVQSIRPAAPPALSGTPAPVTWDNRSDLVAHAREQIGKVTTVKVTLIGTPARTVVRQQFTLVMLTYTGPLPSLPKGIPIPAQVPETTYIVYIGAKQWNKVKDALTDPTDALIVEGVPVYDAQYGAIAVFATHTTTKALQRAKRHA